MRITRIWGKTIPIVILVFGMIFFISAQSVRPVYDTDIACSNLPDLVTCQQIESNPNPTTSNDKIIKNRLNMLKYFKRMGYTHVIHYVLVNPNLSFHFENNTWVYTGGDYTSEGVAVGFRNTKAAIEHYGLRMIPLVPGPTHIGHLSLVQSDPSISEFYDPTTSSSFLSYWSTNHYGYSWNTLNPNNKPQGDIDQVAKIGKYPDDPNTSLDKVVEIALRIIDANWGNTTLGGAYPEFVHISHDEMGYYGACFIAEGQSKHWLEDDNTLTKSDLIAREIAFRYGQVQHYITHRSYHIVKCMIWGDCLVPGDLGELYLNKICTGDTKPAGAQGLCGDTIQGFGGILYKLKNDTRFNNSSYMHTSTYPIAPNLIIMPWMYKYANGIYRGSLGSSTTNPFDIKFNKIKQLKYLDTLGYKYIPLTGDDGFSNTGKDHYWVENTKQCTYEWVQAAQKYPANCLGYGSSLWHMMQWAMVAPTDENFDPLYYDDGTGNDPNTLKAGFNLPILAYTAWTYRQSIKDLPYSPIFYSNLKFQKSRNLFTWDNSIYNSTLLKSRLPGILDY